MMEMELLYFGQLTDITGCASQRLLQVKDTDSLRMLLFEQYPRLQHVKFMIAINNKLISENQPIPADARIALMPPFSGG
jgi:molybdopterin synthase sulfur carrier subunit